MSLTLKTPLDVIELIRLSRPDSAHYFMHGGCWDLFVLLRRVFPGAEPFHTWMEFPGHVATKIEGHLYDLRGRVKRPALYSPFVINSHPSLKFGHRPHRWSRPSKPKP